MNNVTPTNSDRPASRPRVLQCVSHLALGGAERVALTLVEALKSEYAFSMYAVRGLADGGVGSALKQQLITSDIPLAMGPRIPMRYGGMISGAIGLARAVRRFQPAVIHLHTEIPEASYAVMARLFPSLRSIPVIRTIHNAVVWQFWPALGRACDRQMANALVAGVSTAAMQAFLSLRRSSGAKQSTIPPTTIYNGVHPVSSVAAPRTKDGVIRMVYGGRFEPEKGTDLFPEILARARLPAGRPAHLTIQGSGRHALALRWLERNSPKGWTVEVRSPMPDFAAQLASYDLALMPSRHEGLPLIAVEALLAGIQLVATDAPGLREALPSSHPWLATAGDSASFAAAIEFACANEDRWPAIAESGRSFALDRFSVRKMAAGYRSLYEIARMGAAETQPALT